MEIFARVLYEGYRNRVLNIISAIVQSANNILIAADRYSA